MVTIDEQVKCIRRELNLRLQVYPGWVKAGRMKEAAAEREIERMRAVLETLERLAAERGAD